MLTADVLRSELRYDAETGHFRWRDDRPPRPGPDVRGKDAGTRIWSGYVVIKIGGKRYYAHRLAWLYVQGEWPQTALDHADGNRANNAIGNLRISTHAQNSTNKHTQRHIAPYRGVMPHGPGFVARIHAGGKRHYLGYFTTAEEARDAYVAKAKELHGDFAFHERIPVAPHVFLPASCMGLGFAGMN